MAINLDVIGNVIRDPNANDIVFFCERNHTYFLLSRFDYTNSRATVVHAVLVRQNDGKEPATRPYTLVLYSMHSEVELMRLALDC